MSIRADFNVVLRTISDIVARYQSGEFLTPETLRELHRELSTNLYYLNQFRCHFKDEWDRAYLECKESTAAAKTRYADREVKELYYCRKLAEAGRDVSISIGYQLRND